MGTVIPRKGESAALGRPGRYARKSNRCSRHFDPRQTGVRRRRSPSAAHAPRKRSGTRHGTWAEVHPVVVDTAGGIDPPDSHRPVRASVRVRDCQDSCTFQLVQAGTLCLEPPLSLSLSTPALSAYSSALLDFPSRCAPRAFRMFRRLRFFILQLALG